MEKLWKPISATENKTKKLINNCKFLFGLFLRIVRNKLAIANYKVRTAKYKLAIVIKSELQDINVQL